MTQNLVQKPKTVAAAGRIASKPRGFLCRWLAGFCATSTASSSERKAVQSPTSHRAKFSGGAWLQTSTYCCGRRSLQHLGDHFSVSMRVGETPIVGMLTPEPGTFSYQPRLSFLESTIPEWAKFYGSHCSTLVGHVRDRALATIGDGSRRCAALACDMPLDLRSCANDSGGAVVRRRAAGVVRVIEVWDA